MSDMRCRICHEAIEYIPLGSARRPTLVHSHSRDEYCGTGDGAMALPVDEEDPEL